MRVNEIRSLGGAAGLIILLMGAMPALAEDPPTEPARLVDGELEKRVEELEKRQAELAKAVEEGKADDSDPEKLLAPPEQLKDLLKAQPWGVSIGVALAINVGLFGDKAIDPALAAMPYLSWRPTFGPETQAYCAAQRFGDEYAKSVADGYARRRTKHMLLKEAPAGATPPTSADVDAKVLEKTGWDLKKEGLCWWNGLRGFGLYAAGILPYTANVGPEDPEGSKRPSRSVNGGLSLGAQYQVYAFSLMTGPALVFVSVPYESTKTRVVDEWGWLFALGGSFDLGKLFVK